MIGAFVYLILSIYAATGFWVIADHLSEPVTSHRNIVPKPVVIVLTVFLFSLCETFFLILTGLFNQLNLLILSAVVCLFIGVYAQSSILLKPRLFCRFFLFGEISLSSRKNGLDAIHSLRGILLVLSLCSVFILFFPPFESIIDGSDASVYLSAAAHFLHSGSLFGHDGLLLNPLSSDERAWFFMNFFEGREEFVRYPGGFIFISGEKNTYFPSFMHVFPMLSALLGLFGGLSGLFFVNILCYGMAMLSLLYIAKILDNEFIGYVTILLLSCHGIELYFTRYQTAELAGQSLFLCGLLFLLLTQKQGNGFSSIVAALFFVLFLLTRIDAVFFIGSLIILLLLLRKFIDEKKWVLRFLMQLIFLLLPALYYIDHYGNYHGIYLPFFEQDSFIKPVITFWGQHEQILNSIVFYVLWIGAGFIVYVSLNSVEKTAGMKHEITARFLQHRSVLFFLWALRMLVMIGITIIFLDYLSNQRCDFQLTGRWFVWYSGFFSLVVLGLGLYRFLLIDVVVKKHKSLLLTCICFIPSSFLFLYKPQVESFQLWGMRRFVPIFLPIFILFGLLGLRQELKRYLPRYGNQMFIALVVIVALFFLSYSHRIMEKSLEQGILEQLQQFDTQFPHEAIILFERQLAGLHIHTGLKFFFNKNTIVLQRDLWEMETVRSVLEHWAVKGMPIYLVVRQRGPDLGPLILSRYRGENLFSVRKVERTIGKPAKKIPEYEYPLHIYELVFGQR